MSQAPKHKLVIVRPTEEQARQLRLAKLRAENKRLDDELEERELMDIVAKKKARLAELNAPPPPPPPVARVARQRQTPTVRLSDASSTEKRLRLTNEQQTQVGPVMIVQSDANDYPLREDTIGEMVGAVKKVRAKYVKRKVRDVAFRFRSSQEHQSVQRIVVPGDLSEERMREKLLALLEHAFASNSIGTWELIGVELSL